MKKLLSLFLALVLFASTLVLTFTSCEKETEKEENKTVNNNLPVSEGDIFAERAAIDDELETVDYGGRKFRVVGHSGGEAGALQNTEVNKGDLMKDAVYNRTLTVENRFNVDIEAVYVGGINEVADWVSKSVLSSSDEFDLLTNHVLTTAGMVTKNLFLNWYDIPNVDFSKPWWAKSNVEELTYDGKAILAISDYNTSAISCTYCMVFNKNLASSYDMGNLYEVVDEGKWTFDYFLNLVEDVYVDTDGDGDKSMGDFYGMIQASASRINQWLWAFDNPIMGKDEEGVPTIVIKTDKINSIVSSLYDYCYNTKGVFFDSEIANETTTMFLEKKGIFLVVNLSYLLDEGFRNFEDEYGVLPLPKWDENQDDYYTMAFGEHTVSAIPKTVKDTEFVGTIVEALAAESYKQVTPTYYEIALKTRYLRDSESKKVLDTIIQNRVFDFGFIYDGWQGFAYTLNDLMETGSSNFESYYNKRFRAARLQYKKITKIFDKLG